MEFSLISTLSESKFFPTETSLKMFSPKEVAERLFLYLCAVRVLACDHHGKEWLRHYLHKTTLHGSMFDKWLYNTTDLYVLLYGIKGIDREEKWANYGLNHRHIKEWFHDVISHNSSDTISRNVLFKLDRDLHIHSEELKTIRRLSADFPKLDSKKKHEALEKLIGQFKNCLHRSEILPELEKMQTNKSISENASCGATASGAIAAVPGGLGVGFDNDFSKSIYPAPTKKKKKLLIKRR